MSLRWSSPSSESSARWLRQCWFSSFFALRARTRNEAQRQQRLDERDEERRRTAFKDRRDICIALNTSARDFSQALRNLPSRA